MRNDESQLVKPSMEEHPAVELLRQYEEGKLPAQLSHQLEEHMLDCELCADTVEGMALSSRTQTDRTVQALRQRIHNRLRKQKKKKPLLHGLSDWRVAVAILMLFFLILLLFMYQYIR